MLPRHTSCLRWDDLRALVEGDRVRVPDGRWMLPTPTGRHALWAWLEHSGLQPGDRVLVAAYNFHPVVAILVQRGLVPVFVDVERDTLCLDPDHLAARCDERCRLVLATHMFGHPADLGRIGAFCRERGLLLFEDCAHGPGILHDGRQVGGVGDGALFSFGVYKIVNALGGGMLVSRRPVPPAPCGGARRAWIDVAVRLAVTLLMTPGAYGWTLHPLMRHTRLGRTLDPSDNDPDYRFDPAGRGPFLPFMEALVARQLARLEENVARRRALIARLRAELPGLGWLEPDRHGRSNGAYLGVRGPDPRALERRGIASRLREFLDCSRLPQFREFAADCPVAREAEETVLRIPSYPCMTEADRARLAAALEET